MKTQVFIHITQNKVTNRQVLKLAFESLHDGRYLVSIEGANKRSLNQNAYYHGVIVPMVRDGLREAGWNEIRTNEDAHDFIKTKFLRIDIANEKTGELIERTGSTAKLSKLEFNQLIDDVIQWAVEFLNIEIPYPNEQMQLNY